MGEVCVCVCGRACACGCARIEYRDVNMPFMLVSVYCRFKTTKNVIRPSIKVYFLFLHKNDMNVSPNEYLFY